MNKEKFILQEEINRMKELATYDKSKTLNEQGSFNIKDPVAIKQYVSFPCVPNHPRGQQSKMSDGSFTFNIDGEYYYSNGRKKTKDGKMVNYTCNDVIFKTNTTPTQPAKKPTTITDQNIIKGLTFEYTYPGDKTYVYAIKDNVWYGKSNSTNRIFDISKSFPSTAKKLASGAIKGTLPSTAVSGNTTQQVATQQAPIQAAAQQTQGNLQAVTAPNVPQIAKKITDMNMIELTGLKQKTPLLFNNMYGKLGAIEKLKIDNKLAGRPA